MHPPELRTRVLDLLAQGLSDAQVAGRTGLERTTVRSIRRSRTWEHCPRCWRRSRPLRFTPADYAELLGLYLGDGCIAVHERTERLRLSLDPRYQGIVGDTEVLLRRAFPENRVSRVRADGGRTVVLSVYSSHLSCLFPQHGAGKKHERRILLEPWQARLVEQEPWAFLRGCIRSDGCVFVNRTGPYAYVSYEFRNHSADLLRLFAWACRLVGAEHRIYASRVRIYRRASVALFAEHVGTKR